MEPVVLTPEQREKFAQRQEDREKNEENRKPIKTIVETKGGSFDAALDNTSNTKPGAPSLVTNPIANFDGIDMDDQVSLFGGRFAPPDTNSDTGPNHVVMAINSAIRVYNKTGTGLTTLASLGSLFSTIGGPCASTNDGDPIVLYDPLADRWLISEFCGDFTVNNSMHELIAISKTGDPTGAYFLYDFLMPAGRFTDYPHLGVWPDGYYMATNDFNTSGTAFLGDSFFAFNRAKLLVGDPTANYVSFSNNFPANPLGSGGFLPTDLDGVSLPPAGTPNLIIQFLADEFGDPIDGLRIAEFVPNYTTPASSTLTQLPDVALAAFDARQPSSRALIDQPPPAGAADSLDAIADRLMHRLAYRNLSGGVQSYVLDFTVNVSGVNPTNAATYQGGTRWTELRRNNGTGAMSVNQQATYAPGSGNGATGRNLGMGSVAQDGEGNIGLAASATGISPALNPTAIYTGRLFADPLNTTPQGEVDAMSAVTRGVQTGTGNRWGDYSSLMVDPADECTFWGTFEYVDSPTADFDWNTRIFSFKVNPACVSAPKGTIQGTVTNCASGLPIANAIVTTPDGFLRQTNASGMYSMSVAPGTYTVNITAPGGFNTCTTSNVVVTNGGTATVNCCLTGVPTIVKAGATIISESCAPANGAIDPSETVTISFCVQNTGGANTTSLVGTLQATGGVTSPSGPQNYGVVVAGGPAVCRSFTFTANGNCGDTITASLQLQDGASNLGTLTYNFSLGALGSPVTTTYSSGNIAVPIPDVSTVEVPLNVPDAGAVNDLNVSVRLNHTFDGDLVISLVHPDGTVIALSTNRGGAGANYGSGANDCSGTPTVFDDEAATAISAGTAPFAGSFRPESPLSGLDGKPINGTWKLRVADTAAIDVGTIGCVQLIINRLQFVCCGVAGTPVIASAGATLISESCTPANGAIDPNETATVSFCVQNVGTGSTTNLVGTLQATGGITNPSGPQNYGVVVAAGPAVCRNFTFTANGACGGTVTASIQFQDGATNLGTVTYTFTLGTVVNTNFGPFSNTGSITIPAGAPATSTGPAAPYPSDIIVAGVTGAVSKVTATLTGLNHTFPDDIDILLVGPGGQKILLMSDAGGSADLVNVNLTFDDAAANSLPDGTVISSGTFKPTNFGTGDTFPAPAPAGPYTDPQLLSVFNGVNPNGTWSLYVFDDASDDVGSMAGGWSISFTTSTPVCSTSCVSCTGITCPADITTLNNPNQCGAVVNYPAPTTNGTCAAPTCSPASGSIFPVGMTTVTCTTSGPPQQTCTFKVTVNDTQAPTITCPPDQSAVTNQGTCPSPSCAVVTYPAPVVSDNCPGVGVVCNPASGSCFPAGVTTVTCTATDASGNMATCSFMLTVFDVALQDDSDPSIILLWNSISGQYRFCCKGVTYAGVGKPTVQGCVYTLQHTPADRRVLGRVDKAVRSGTASIQTPPGNTRCTITDRNTLNDTLIPACQ